MMYSCTIGFGIEIDGIGEEIVRDDHDLQKNVPSKKFHLRTI